MKTEKFNGWDFVSQASESSWNKGQDNEYCAAYAYGNFVGFITMAFSVLERSLTQEQVNTLNKMLAAHKN